MELSQFASTENLTEEKKKKKNNIWGISFIIIALVFLIQLFQSICKNIYPAYVQKKNKQDLGRSEGRLVTC